MGMRNLVVSGVVRMLIITSLTMSSIGCAQSSSTQHSDNTPFLNAGGMSADVEGLHIQSLNGIGVRFLSPLKAC